MTEDEVKAAVKEAVSEALRGHNLVDGPTHIAHHQAFEEFLVLTRFAKKSVVGALVGGLVAIVMLGMAAWKNS